MQLLSIFRLTRISVVWRSAAEAVLLAMSIAPISSYGWVSFECLLREGLSPQQYALDSTLASTYIPGAYEHNALAGMHASALRRCIGLAHTYRPEQPCTCQRARDYAMLVCGYVLAQTVNG